MSVNQPIMDADRCDAEVSAWAGRYTAAAPFPHIILDDLLEPGTLARAQREFPNVEGPSWTNYLHVNERKFGNPDPETWGPTLKAIASELMSPSFVAFLERLTGIDNLRADPEFDGGGLHVTEPGGFLNVHTDFTAHHSHRNWRRRVNLLLYLNDDWRAGYGGELEFWDAEMRRCEQRIEPSPNRMVVFSTSRTSLHGHPTPLSSPAGVPRRSMALYYFTEEVHPLTRPTRYRATPGTGARRVLIGLDNRLLGLYDVAKRRFGFSDTVASRWLGRSTTETTGPLRRRSRRSR